MLTTNVDVLIEAAYGEKDFDLLVSKEDFEKFSVSENESEGTLMKFHGTVDLTKTGLSKYESFRFLLDQVEEGTSEYWGASGFEGSLRKI